MVLRHLEETKIPQIANLLWGCGGGVCGGVRVCRVYRSNNIPGWRAVMVSAAHKEKYLKAKVANTWKC